MFGGAGAGAGRPGAGGPAPASSAPAAEPASEENPMGPGFDSIFQSYDLQYSENMVF